MAEYEIKEFGGKDLIPYGKLSAVMFKAKIAGFDNEEEYIKNVEEVSQKRAKEIVRLGAFYEGKLYAAIQSWSYDGVFDGETCEMTGIGGVISDFNSPFKGAIPAIFTKAFEMMREKGQYISHLYPFDETYYRQFGYDVSAETAEWKIPVEKLMVKREGKVVAYDGSPEMQNDIKNVHKVFSENHNLSLFKTEAMWQSFFDSIKPYESGMNSFVHYDADGNPDAFMNYVLANYDNKPYDICTRNLWFIDIKSLTGMLSYFGTQKSYCDKLCITLPTHIDLGPVINAKGGNGKRISERCVKNCGMTRVVDVEKVLSMAKYKGEGSFCIQITDDTYAPWNTGTYTVTYGKETTVTRGGKADIEMDINAFSAAIMGRFDFEALQIFDSVKIINDKSFENVFFKKPMFIIERF